MAKVIADKASHRILGVQIVGRNSTDLIAEGMLAIEMGARLEDVALTLHPHPELCEVFYEACARAAGMSTNMRPQRG
jgi:dihydrolipoamide dehydrogenase